jgi:hypothetical protein
VTDLGREHVLLVELSEVSPAVADDDRGDFVRALDGQGSDLHDG